MNREKQLTIALLKEKLQKLSGKKVVFEPTIKEAKVKKLIEAIEKLSGRKVVLEDAPVSGAVPSVAATATPAANTQAAPGTQATTGADAGKIAAAKAVQAMAVDPILSKAVAQVAQQPQVKQLATEATMNEEVISLAAMLIGLAAIGALAGIAQLVQNAAENAAQKRQILAAIAKDFAKAGVQATPEQIDAELTKRVGAAKTAEASKVYQNTGARRGY